LIADLLDRLTRIDPKKSIWMFARTVKVSSLNALMKWFGLRFKAIGPVRFAAHRPTILGHRQRNIEQPGPIGLPSLLGPGFEDRNPFGRHPTAPTLVGIGGIGESITDDPGTAFEGGIDHLGEVLSAPRKQQ
jgi:hypothetical protein